MPASQIDEITVFLSSKIMELTEQTGGIVPIGNDDLLANAGMDSANTIHLVVLIEQKYDITFDDEELLLENFKTIGTISENIKKKLGTFK